MWLRVGIISLKILLSIAALILLAKPSAGLSLATGHKHSSFTGAAFLPTLIAIWWWGSASIVKRFRAVLISATAGIALWFSGDLFSILTNPSMSALIVGIIRGSAPFLAVVLCVVLLRNVQRAPRKFIGPRTRPQGS